MASLNKTTVRTEVDKLKADFQKLSSDGKLSAEVLVLINSLMLILDLILAIFLEKTTVKTSKNFSYLPLLKPKRTNRVTNLLVTTLNTTRRNRYCG